MRTQSIRVRKTGSICDDVDKLNDQIMRRAYDIFLRNGSPVGKEVDNWLAAERELVWRPAIEVREKEREFLVDVAVPGVDPADIDIEITPDDLLVKGEVQHEHTEEEGKVHTCEFEAGNLFRAVHFPKKIDPDKVKAEFKNGMLRIKARIAEEKTKKIKIGAA